MALCKLDLSAKHNWVEDAGGLPRYIHEVACSVMESGHDVSSAIAIAVSRMKVWAATGSGETKAKAAAALAEWEAMRAKAKAKRGSNMEYEYRASGGFSYDPDKHQVAARVMQYNTVDDHGTEFAPGCFAESLKRGGIKSVYQHDGSRPIGKVVDYRDSADGLDVVIQLADPDAVADSKLAHALMKEDILNEFSVGFIREKDEKGGTRITKAGLIEVSPVLKGSNPGTRTLAVRSATRSEATDLLNKVALGELSAEEALATLVEPDVRDSVTIPQTEYRSLMERAGVEPPKSDAECCFDFESEYRAIDDLFGDWS